jgi:hypothetical protein
MTRDDVRSCCQDGGTKITVVVCIEHTLNLPVESCHWQDSG